jgi:SpoIID/LytB domain protein
LIHELFTGLGYAEKPDPGRSPPMRRLLTLTLAAVALALTTSAAAQTFAFRGHGYGHGVGMGQWGAEGFAQNGWTFDRILGHYYHGTTLGPAPVVRLRVLLASGRTTISVSSDAPFSARDAAGEIDLPAGTVELGADLSIQAEGGRRALQSPVRFEPGAAPLRFDRAYRGALVVQVVGGSLSLVNDLGLEQYVAAVVPHEMPTSWDLEALKAQAVAARTYAIKVRKPGIYFDVKSDPIAQAYEGVEEENPRTTEAVEATKGLIVLYDGEPAWTLYSSSSGGRTAALTDAFPGGQDLPYLVPVDDPFDGSLGNPNHDWGPLLFSGEELARKLGLPGPPASVRVRPSVSGRVAALVARGAGWSKEIPGPTVRTSLGLRSTLLDVKKQSAGRRSS